MSGLKSPLEVYKLLEKSNCGLCLLPSCMAFAGAVFKGEKMITDCPRLDPEVAVRVGSPARSRPNMEEEQARLMVPLKEELADLQLDDVAVRLGLSMRGEHIAVNCLGKDFFIDRRGEMTSECHVNNWIHVPILKYLTGAKSAAVSGEWSDFSELPEARSWANFFSHRCEKALKEMVDAGEELIYEILDLFESESLDGFADADRSLLLRPLPGMPVAICYWRPEEGLDSRLKIYFDRSATDIIDIESIYRLCTGIVEMIRKISHKHG